MPATDQPSLTIIIPTLNEIERLPALLAGLRDRFAPAWVVVADGGSSDGSQEFAQTFCDAHPDRFRLVRSAPGRAHQMNRGAALVSSGWMLFLHADTRLPASAGRRLTDAWGAGCRWGRFDVRFDTAHRALRLVAWCMNARSHWTGIATGDQAIFVRAETFAAVGGYPPIPLMEDIALSKLLRAHARPCRVRTPVITSARRWRQGGVMRTIVKMWGLRLAYWLGVAPERLAARYPRTR